MKKDFWKSCKIQGKITLMEFFKIFRFFAILKKVNEILEFCGIFFEIQQQFKSWQNMKIFDTLQKLLKTHFRCLNGKSFSFNSLALCVANNLYNLIFHMHEIQKRFSFMTFSTYTIILVIVIVIVVDIKRMNRWDEAYCIQTFAVIVGQCVEVVYITRIFFVVSFDWHQTRHWIQIFEIHF